MPKAILDIFKMSGFEKNKHFHFKKMSETLFVMKPIANTINGALGV
jgi:hypothetical protein